MTTVQSETKPFKCFISFAEPDAKLATRIADAMRSTAKCEVSSVQDVSPGESWRRRLDEKVKDADFFVVLVSPEALSSKFVRDEWASIQERAWQSQNVGILPILVGKTDAPAFLKPWKYIDATDKKPADVSNAVMDYIQSLDTNNLISEELHKSSPELSTERTNRFRGLLRSVAKDDWTA